MPEESMPFPILHTKLHRPPLTVDLVPRPELLAWLDRHRDQSLTLVSAPAGYGKTTLVSSWLETLERPTAWLSLDEQDDDLTVFLAYLIAAIQTQFSHAGQDTLALLNGRSLSPFAVLVRRFSNDLEALEGGLTLVLDDFHVIRDLAIHNFLHELLQHPGVCVSWSSPVAIPPCHWPPCGLAIGWRKFASRTCALQWPKPPCFSTRHWNVQCPTRR